MEPNRVLNLAYVFNPTPAPIIRASLPDSVQNITGLQVVISNPAFDEFKFKLIQIEIPVGEEIAADLSTEARLPDPDYDTGGKWKIAIDPIQTDTIRVSPKNPGEAIKGDAIIFTIPGIKINTKPGTVMITVAEDDTLDSDTYFLVKQPSDFPVTKFWADPAILPDLDLTTQLFWNGDDILGPNYIYNLRAVDGSWQSLKHQWNEGATGIQTPPLIQENTTFALDVVKADSSGHSIIIGTVTTQVSVDEPEIVKAYMEPTATNHYYRLHWLTRNTTRCDLLLDNQPLSDHLPIDTYHQGYPVNSMCFPGTHQFTLVAYGKSEDVKAYYQFPDFTIKSQSISLHNLNPDIIVTDIAVTKDNGLAILRTSNSIIFVDIAKRLQLDSMPLGPNAYRVAVTPDNKFVFAISGNVTVINIPARSTAAVIPINNPVDIAVTPDGRQALVVTSSAKAINLIDIPDWSIEGNIPLNTSAVSGIAVTPDSKLALAIDPGLNQVTVIDITNRSAEAKKIPLGPAGYKPIKLAITPDGIFALIVNSGTYNVTMINIAQRSVDTIIPVGKIPLGIAITNDSRYAFVTNGGDNSISVIDIYRRSVIASFPTDCYPSHIAVTPDNTVILVKRANNLYSLEFIY